jgi:hypothetical protein
VDGCVGMDTEDDGLLGLREAQLRIYTDYLGFQACTLNEPFPDDLLGL